jgi:hypothetical protein
MKEELLSCGSCGSVSAIELASETCLHFPGLKGLNMEPIFIFPKTVVCLNCGSMQSSLAEREIEQVEESRSQI